MGLIRPTVFIPDPAPVDIGSPAVVGASAQSLLTGGGVRTVTPFSASTSGVSWSNRIIWIAAGRGTGISTSGYFEIALPANGTTITGHGGASNHVVAGGKIDLTGWQALYYDLPFGSSHTSVPTNFHIVDYTADFEVPSTWVMIAKNNVDIPYHVVWWDGQRDTGWVVLTLVNSWTNYGQGYRNLSCRLLNRTVHFDGLLYPPSAGNPSAIQITTLPAGMRPAINFWGEGRHNSLRGIYYIQPSGFLGYYNDGAAVPYIGVGGLSFLLE